MKKSITILVTLLVVIAVTLSACKSHERCPAYGKVPSQATTRI
jgi:hypothetical protein